MCSVRLYEVNFTKQNIVESGLNKPKMAYSRDLFLETTERLERKTREREGDQRYKSGSMADGLDELEVAKNSQRQLDIARYSQIQLDIARDSQRMLEIARDSQRQLEIARDSQRQLEITRDSQRQLEIARDSQRQLEIAREEIWSYLDILITKLRTYRAIP